MGWLPQPLIVSSWYKKLKNKGYDKDRIKKTTNTECN